MRQFWLSRKSGKKAALFPVINDGNVHFKIVGDGYEKMPREFDPLRGTVKGAVVTCPVCGTMIDANTTRKLFRKGQGNQCMIAVVVGKKGTQGKFYRIATNDDVSVYDATRGPLAKQRKTLAAEWGIDPVPTELIHTPDGRKYNYGQPLYNFLPVLLYGMKTWGDLFNDRQKLSIITFIQKVRAAYEEMIDEGHTPEYAKALVSYLALMVDRLADKNATLVFYNAHAEKIEHVFGRQALSMVWDYVELNPFTSVGWPNMSEWVHRNIKQLALSSSSPALVTQANVTSLKLADGMFDAVFTDPPYYDNIPYADWYDFFYVWLKRSVGHLYPELFSTPLTPKSAEIIAELPLLRGMNKSEAVDRIPGIKTKKDFERMLSQAFGEIHRVLKQGGIAVIVYAHKSTEGWETLINSLIDSGLVVTAAWPINTEKRGRLRAHESAALASSIYIVARKTKQRSTGFYKDVKGDLRKHLNRRLEKLWSEGIGGADFFIAAIGSAIEIFGIYKEVIDYEGTPIRADRLLDDVREIATNYAIQQILHNGFSGEVSQLTRFYVLFRWNYKLVRIDFDEARKLAQSCGLELSEHWSGTGFIRKEKEFIKVLGPQERELKDLQGHTEMIDVLHHVLLLWEKGKRDKMSEILTESGFHRNEVFWRVAQAISETLSIQDKEKKLLDGFLAGRNGYFDREQYDQVTVQGLPVKTSRKKKRSGQSPQIDREDEHEQVKLE
jgi:adenine-specific DNA methylase